MTFAFSFLFMIASVLVMLVGCWCWLCFKIGCWMMRGMTRPFRRSVSAYPAAPQPAVIPIRAAAVPPTPPYSPHPRHDRAGMCSRRRHGGGAAVVMTVLAVGLVVFGIRTFFHSDSAQRSRARTAQAQRQLERRMQDANAQAIRTERDLERRVQEAKQRAMAVLVRDNAQASSVRDDIARVSRKDGSWNVTGYGKTNEDAWQNALEKAYAPVSEYLHERIRGLQWPISTEFIANRLVKKSTPAPLHDEPSGETLAQMDLQVEITPEDQGLVLESDRRYRMEHRMIWLGEILAAVLVMLATGAAYVRLDEASKGYYTGWLRLAALASMASAGATLWYFA